MNNYVENKIIRNVQTPRNPLNCSICKSQQIRFNCSVCNLFLCSSICSDKHKNSLHHREKQ